jgi:hypothetical protein
MGSEKLAMIATCGGCEKRLEFPSSLFDGKCFAKCPLCLNYVALPYHKLYAVSLDPAWLTTTVKQLAAAIYEERAFDRMPILGDALEEAGCSNVDILNHCRQPGEHVRGCWVVDLNLAKS